MMSLRKTVVEVKRLKRVLEVRWSV